MIDFAELDLFSGEEHAPFTWREGRPAALMVHSFPGTPAEMRPLAHELHHSGWTVQGVLMPGFGTDINSLLDRQYEEWVDAVQNAYRVLRLNHSPVIVVGYSLGGAVALNVAARERLPSLVLLAPFWRFGQEWHYWLWQVVKHLLWRGVRLLHRADFQDPQVRKNIQTFIPDLNLDDPEIQEILREFRLSPKVIDQVVRAGRNAYRHLEDVTSPTLIVQGQRDEVVRPLNTHQLIPRINAPIQYVEVDATHELMNKQADWWPYVARAVVNYTQQFIQVS